MNRFTSLLIIVLALAVVLAGAGIAAGNRFLDAPLSLDGPEVYYEIRQGVPFATVSAELAQLGMIDRPDWFRWYARLSGKAQKVRAGEYTVSSGTTARQLLDQFVAGDVRQYSFTIVEGWNFRELMSALESDEHIVSTVSADDWPAVLESLGADASFPEGLFLPETYHFPKGTSDVDVLRQALDLQRKALTEEWASRAAGLPLQSPYEALVLASIIEKETAKVDERARIAGVFVRRLQKNMRLQTDPTVIYGVGENFDGNLTRRHLRTDTPYNTYTRHGLPPTPIAMPGRAAIHAALNPEDGTELYFVATGLGDGSHAFSETKDQHDAAVQRYLARQRATRANSQGKP
ncbi:MAG: endolytic transglycosylase MltG [Gammaproteobacteria bacterium]|nr:endolytic transglycosylase MltG [Gammaproteobacteria bacterium]